jgi:hypothetical protein
MPWVAPVCLFLVFVLSFSPWVAIPSADVNEPIHPSAWKLAFGEHYNLLLTFALLLHLVTVLLAGFIVGLTLNVIPLEVPHAVQQLWPRRALILGGLAAVTLFFLLLQLLLGFRIEEVHASDAYASFIYRTNWLRLAVFFQLLAVAGALTDYWLSQRGDRPLPRIDISW